MTVRCRFWSKKVLSCEQDGGIQIVTDRVEGILVPLDAVDQWAVLCGPFERIEALQAFEVFDADQDGGRFAVLFDHDAFSSVSGSLEELRELIFGLSCGDRHAKTVA